MYFCQDQGLGVLLTDCLDTLPSTTILKDITARRPKLRVDLNLGTILDD